MNWCREQHHLLDPDTIAARANELVSQYLQDRIAEGKSAYTLASERSALRFYFSNRDLAQAVALPRRVREHITRSRTPAIRDQDFQPANWTREISFLESTGLRRAEALALRLRHIVRHPSGVVTVFVARGKGGKSRTVPVLPGREQDVLVCLEGKEDRNAPVFPRLPSHLDIHDLRRTYAQTLYCHLSSRELPPPEGRLRPADYDREAASHVSVALGHGERRIGTIMRHYLR
jgi:integrase